MVKEFTYLLITVSYSYFIYSRKCVNQLYNLMGLNGNLRRLIPFTLPLCAPMTVAERIAFSSFRFPLCIIRTEFFFVERLSFLFFFSIYHWVFDKYDKIIAFSVNISCDEVSPGRKFTRHFSRFENFEITSKKNYSEIIICFFF